MKKSTLIALSVLLALGIAVGHSLAGEAPAGPLQVTNFGDKAPVMFDHGIHSELACVDCHHNEAESGYKCSDCHKAEADGATPKMKDAAHKKESGKCYSCHFGKEPTAKKLKCADCHKK